VPKAQEGAKLDALKVLSLLWPIFFTTSKRLQKVAGAPLTHNSDAIFV
jgi:hypothetical protein